MVVGIHRVSGCVVDRVGDQFGVVAVQAGECQIGGCQS
jgi:hypothetical protein